jgi:hypothetical protein
MAASKNAHAVPSRQCCTNLANMGKGLPGAKCLCSLLSSSLAKSNGVVPRIALGIPQKCRIPVPKGFVCQDNASITHPTLLYYWTIATALCNYSTFQELTGIQSDHWGNVD